MILDKSEQDIKFEQLSPEQKEIYNLMKNDKKFIAIHDIMLLQNKIKEMETVRDYAMGQVKTMMPDDNISILEARADMIDKESVIKLDMSKDEDWKKIEEVYTLDNGDMLHFTKNPDLNNIKIREMHRDFLIYLKTINEETAKFNVIEKEHKEAIDKLFKELEEILGESEVEKIRNYASFADYYREWINNSLARDDLSEGLRNQLQKTLDADNRGVDLEFLKKEINELIARKGDAKSLKFGYKNNFSDICRKVNAILAQKFSKYNFHISFAALFDIEKRVFPDTYGEKYNNLFIFILFRFIRANYEKFDNFWMITIGEIVTQLGFLLKEESERPESSKLFQKNYHEVMNLVINH